MKQFGPRLKILHCRTDRAITGALAQMDLTAAQGHILAYLARQSQPPCPRDLEEAFRLRHSTVSGLLTRLEKKGFVAVVPDREDRRCKRVSLLPRGQDCVQRLGEEISAIEQTMVRDFTEEDKERFRILLDRAIENLGGIPQNPCQQEDNTV